MSSALFTGRVPRASFRRIDAMLEREPKRIEREVKKALVNWGNDWVGKVQARFGSGSAAGDSLVNRRGRLRGTLRKELTGDSLATFRLRMLGGRPDVPYARIQEYGGVVKPTKSKYLAFPIADGLTPAGRPLGATSLGARAFIEAHKGQTFFAQSKRGGLVLLWKKTPRSKPLLMFALARQVEIPGPKAPTKKRPSRLAFFDTWAALSNERKRDLQKIARGAGRG